MSEPTPDEIFMAYLIELRTQLTSRVLSKEDVLWSLVQAKHLIADGIRGMMSEPGDPSIPEGWPPDG